MHETRTFKSGNSEAVRLPKGMGFGIGVDVRVERDGNRIVVTPIADPAEDRRRVQALLAALRAIGPVGEIQQRDEIEVPDRYGLY